MFDKDEQEISRIVQTSLDSILAGESTVDEVLARHPARAVELRAEIETAMWLVSRRKELDPRPGFMLASRKRLLRRIEQEAHSHGEKRAFWGLFLPQTPVFQLALVLMLVIFAITSATGVVSASFAALPGEDLYAVKRIYERVTLDLTINQVQRVDLSAQYSERRLNEVEVLIVHGKYDKVEVALNDFEEEVKQTIVLLEQVSEREPILKQALAIALNENLDRQSERIETLKEAAPQAVQEDLQRASDTSSRGAEAALSVVDRIREKTSTPTPTVTATRTPTRTQTPTRTRTATPRPTMTPSNTATPVVTIPAIISTPTTAPTNQPANTDTPTPWPTFTPSVTEVPTELPTATPLPPSDTPVPPTPVPPTPVPPTPVLPTVEPPTPVPPTPEPPTPVPSTPTVAPGHTPPGQVLTPPGQGGTPPGQQDRPTSEESTPDPMPENTPES